MGSFIITFPIFHTIGRIIPPNILGRFFLFTNLVFFCELRMNIFCCVVSQFFHRSPHTAPISYIWVSQFHIHKYSGKKKIIELFLLFVVFAYLLLQGEMGGTLTLAFHRHDLQGDSK